MGDSDLEPAERTAPPRAQPASVLELYQEALRKRGFEPDDSQYSAVLRLQQLYQEWSDYKRQRSTAIRRLIVHPPLPRGVYLWGAVGRGKTFLMDSFYRYHADGAPDKLFSTHDQYERLGSTPEERQRAYRELFRGELDSSELSEIRDTANRGWPLGSERFKDEIERALKCAVRPPKRGRPARSAIPSESSEHFS